MVLDLFTDNVIAECTFNDSGPLQASDRSPDFIANAHRYWHAFRSDKLFKRQKHRLEQHFGDHWLSRMTIYVKVQSGPSMPIHNCYVRYLPFADFPVADMDYPVPPTKTTNAIVRVDDAGGTPTVDDSEQVTFFLHERLLHYYDGTMVPISTLITVGPNGIGDEGENEFPIISVNETWARIIANDMDEDAGQPGTAEGLCAVGMLGHGERFCEEGISDQFRSWAFILDVDGLDIVDDGRKIHFMWKPLMTNWLRYLSRPEDASSDED
ncbi:hypothetical protein B0T20DRAFT_375263 [Sordaria brevicollis]|uniref:Uncharacterized protein n=1 Tax=Sordaria brevicollis TaxID=83679 RepID=A0AAE0PGQ2_SORBR|nr:hypothetical protein B0T20DRAFT_375263 [Sordaria brevicollis]